MLGELDTAGLHFDKRAPRPNEIGILGAVSGEADAVFKGGVLRQGVRVVLKGGQQVEDKGLGFALLVALELGGVIGELAKGLFLRCHSWSGN